MIAAIPRDTESCALFAYGRQGRLQSQPNPLAFCFAGYRRLRVAQSCTQLGVANP